MTVKQKTLKGEFSLSGKGLHTGKHVTVTFKPAKEDFGYKIHRIDLDGTPEIPALAEYVKFVDRASCLEKMECIYIRWSMQWLLCMVAE